MTHRMMDMRASLPHSRQRPSTAGAPEPCFFPQVACTLTADAAFSGVVADSDESGDDTHVGELVLEHHSGLSFVWGCNGAALSVPTHPQPDCSLGGKDHVRTVSWSRMPHTPIWASCSFRSLLCLSTSF